MTEQHPISPPPELIQELAKSAGYIISPGWLTYALEKVFQAGADQELEALLVWLRVKGFDNLAADLLAARRPKPPSLKEQALKALKRQSTRSIPSLVSNNDCDTIRRALEALP
jgi:hypothetical protein